MPSWENTKQLEANFITDRPIINEHNTLYRVARLLDGEALELIVAISNFRLNPTEENRKDVLQEVADVGIFALAICRLLEADMVDEMAEKIANNTLRFPLSRCQEGEWTQVYPELKKETKEKKIVERFYE